MQVLKIIFILLFLSRTAGFAQNAEPSTPRHSYQQQFIIKNFLLEKDTLQITEALQVDSIFRVVTESWQRFVFDSLTNKTSLPTTVLNNLDAYSYFWTLLSIAGHDRLNKAVEYHLYKNYMLPSLKKDVEFITDNPSLMDHNLIWAGSLGNTISIGARHDNDTSIFNCLYSLTRDLKTLLASLKSSNKNVENYLKRLLNILNYNTYELESKKYFLNNQPDVAFTYLITGISTNKFPKPQAITFAKKLINYYSLKDEKDKALAVLSNLTLSTTNDELATDTLKWWYYNIDTTSGLALYNSLQRKLTGKSYVVSNEQLIKVPKKWEFVSNAIPLEKLKKAKYILIDFWYSACSPCIAEIPRLNELFKKLENRDDVIFLSINTDFANTKRNEAFVRESIKKHNIQFPVIYDNYKTNLSGQLKVNGYPSKFILTVKGERILKADKSNITLDTYYDYLTTLTN